jgi:signal peptidase I
MEPDVLAYNPEPKPTFSSHVVDFIQTLVVFIAIGTFIYLFIAQPHKVSGSSMFPNFHDGDYIITDKLSYRFGQPTLGDVVVFKNPRDESQDFIKRIIGVAGDKVRLENNHVYLNGKLLPEEYIATDVPTDGMAFLQEGDEITVPEGDFFVLGDNRPHSSDSRDWGYVKKGEIIGKVFLRYWPQNAIGVYPAAAHYPAF